jgi:hypothetical protein
VNKKKQKNFDSLTHFALTVANPAEIKSFLLLFFKKEAFSSCFLTASTFSHTPPVAPTVQKTR